MLNNTSVEETLHVVSSVANLTIFAVPIALIWIFVCLRFRRAAWLPAFWTLAAMPVLTFFILLITLLGKPTDGGPDGGFVGMGIMFTLGFCVFEIIGGIAVLLACPPWHSWIRPSALASVPAAVASIFLMHLAVRYATVPPKSEPGASALAHEYSQLNDDKIKRSFRARAYEAMLGNPTTPVTALIEAAKRLDHRSRYWEELVANPSLPDSVIEQNISDPAIGMKLAGVHNLAPRYLEILGQSSDQTIRLRVARNLATPRETLKTLARDTNDLTRTFARQNLDGTLGEFGY